MKPTYFLDKLLNIGFSTNGEGKNRILNPKGKNSCPSGEATRARNFSLRGKNFILAQAIGRESYSCDFSNKLEAAKITFSRKKITTRARILDHPGGNSILARVICHHPGGNFILARVVAKERDFLPSSYY